MTPVVTPAQVLSALLALPPWVGDRAMSRDERAAMLENHARVWAEEAKNERQLAFLIAYSWEDTKNASHIVHGHCERMPKGERCDGLRARGVLSVHPWCRAMLRYPAGSVESLREETRCALRAAYGGIARCGEHAQSPIHAMFVGEGGLGVPCSSKKADERVKTYRRVLRELRRVKPQDVAKP